MADGLESAISLARRLRYFGDYEAPSPIAFQARSALHFCAQNELRICQAMTPILFDRLNQACKRLLVPEESVIAFTYLSSDVQASCQRISDSQCVLRFSSALVELLDSDEFCFVAGHELAHFLLRHPPQTGVSAEHLIASRAMEISADRLGLVACQSLDVSLKAMMKTASGLSSRHLRFDVRAFVTQCEAAIPDLPAMTNATHPTAIVRTRALLWFSMTKAFGRGEHTISRDEIDALDMRVKRDLDRLIDAPARSLMHELQTSVLLWKAASRAVSDGAYDLTDQRIVADLVGDELAAKLKLFICGLVSNDVVREVSDKLEYALKELQRSMPASSTEICQKLDQEIAGAFEHMR